MRQSQLLGAVRRACARREPNTVVTNLRYLLEESGRSVGGLDVQRIHGVSQDRVTMTLAQLDAIIAMAQGECSCAGGWDQSCVFHGRSSIQGQTVEIALLHRGDAGALKAYKLEGIVAALAPDGAPIWAICGSPADWTASQREGVREKLVSGLHAFDDQLHTYAG